MRYILCMRSETKETKESWEGYATIHSLGLYPSVLKEETIKEKLKNNEKILVKIYEDIESIQKDISEFSKRCRRDDVWHKEQIWKKSKYILKFYPIKVDSSKFPFKLRKYVKDEKKYIYKKVNTDNIYELEINDKKN